MTRDLLAAATTRPWTALFSNTIAAEPEEWQSGTIWNKFVAGDVEDTDRALIVAAVNEYDQHLCLEDAGAKALEYAEAHGLGDATYWVRDLHAALDQLASTRSAA